MFKKKRFRKGMTLIELIVAALAAVILLVGITALIAAGHRNYRTMYNRVNSDVIRNAYEARILFDRIVRQATIRHSIPEYGNSNELRVFYYSDPANINLINPNRYAWFHLSGSGELLLQRGDIDPETWEPINPGPDIPIALNVSSAEFMVRGPSVRMVLVLDNESDPENTNKLETLKMTVTSTAIRHNR